MNPIFEQKIKQAIDQGWDSLRIMKEYGYGWNDINNYLEMLAVDGVINGMSINEATSKYSVNSAQILKRLTDNSYTIS